MAKEKITQRTIDSLRRKPPTIPTFLWDTELQGFGAKVWPSGQVSWIIQKWIGGRGGKAKRVVVGRYPGMDLEKARLEAGEAITATRKGADLVDKRTKARLAKRAELQAIKLSEALDRYLAKKLSPYGTNKRKGDGSKYWLETEAALKRELADHLNKRALELDKQTLKAIIDAKEEVAPVAARNLFAALRPFFDWCVSQELIHTNPLEKLEPPSKPDARRRVLSDLELSIFWSASSADPLFGPVYKLLLLTLQRREEVGGMKRSELDFERSEWTIPAERTKNGKDHIVHLSPQAIEVIQAVPVVRIGNRPSDYVFTTTGDQPISGYSRAKERLDTNMASAGFEGSSWRIHDLRRTGRSNLAKIRVPKEVAEKILNHLEGANSDTDLEGVYNRYEYFEERRQAMELWGTYVDKRVQSNTYEQAEIAK